MNSGSAPDFGSESMIIEAQDEVTAAVLAELHRTPDASHNEAMLLATFQLEPGEARPRKAPITQKVDVPVSARA